jgi:hypothetical protein
MPKEKSRNGLNKPFPGDKLPRCVEGCTTAAEVQTRVDTLTAHALDLAAQFSIANEGVSKAKRNLAIQLQALAPVLCEMQGILSHKSALHYQFAGLNLPTFTDWAKAFVAKAGIQASWSSIKLAMDPRNRKSPSLRSEGHIPATKLQAQRVGFAALAATELADALERDRGYGDALGRLRAAGASKADILAVLKRAGLKDISEFTATASTAQSDPYLHSTTAREEEAADGSNIRPGGYSQVEALLDRVVGPASRIALNIDDPTLQVAGFERIVSYWARKYLPFNTNLGTMEFTVRFVPRAKPELRREPAEAPALEGRALVAATRLLSNSQGSAVTNH